MGPLMTLDRRAFVQHLAGLGASVTGLIVLDGCALLPSTAQRAKIPRVGYLAGTGSALDDPWVMEFWDGLRELGWVDGRTFNIELREQVSGTSDSDLIAELVAVPVDVLVTVGTVNTQAAKRMTDTIPIVFASVGDPVGAGVVANLARPGANVTGVSSGASTPLGGKRLELLSEVIPGLSRLAFLLNSTNATEVLALAQIQEAATRLGIQVQALDVVSPDALDRAFDTAARWPADAIHVQGFMSLRGRVVELATRSHLPAMYLYREFVEDGGLMSYAPSQRIVFRRTAPYVDKILRGARPGDLPVEQLTTIEFAVNVKTAQALGLTLPPDVAAQVTEWVP
jgi:putative ABC transport system substrate-binding protein